ncbi:MAG: peptide chain release factor 2 [Planctomycetes bacterium]|nr:peptide chain release factor 2 [Planctomycetota bacterium]MBT5101704.1 peptide chain release factor 2 [Planctomycetota bacterium]MBT7011580.1 peptide chain release factor 2 [Planctomycetota bacterium]MBT7317780.1 peptide chain release factor 2 [Planctomycetota bacterium]
MSAACNRFERVFDYLQHQEKREKLEALMAGANFWDHQEAAQETIGKMKLSKSVTEPIDLALGVYEEILTLVELGEEMGPEEIEQDLVDSVNRFAAMVDKLEFQVMLGGENDHCDAYLTIQSGAGGNDAADFTEMLRRMYLRWIEKRNFGVEEIEITSGEEGLRHATYLVKGPHAYGWLKAERGVHRLVRISPYDSQNRRHTSFAAVEVQPDFGADAPIEVDMNEVRVDTYRAGGAGGQHVNKTDSAVRMTHDPSGIVVQCQNERSQHKNRAQAIRMLTARLYEMRERERDADTKAMYGSKGEIAWGSQIRSYVLHPYQMVKDHRTTHETGNTQAVLDGDLDAFVEEYLRSKASR